MIVLIIIVRFSFALPWTWNEHMLDSTAAALLVPGETAAITIHPLANQRESLWLCQWVMPLPKRTSKTTQLAEVALENVLKYLKFIKIILISEVWIKMEFD